MKKTSSKNQALIKRQQESVGSKFGDDSTARTLFIHSPSDVGVRRNKGRNGARHAPCAIEGAFKKLNDHLERTSYFSAKVSEQSSEKTDYDASIRASSDKITQLLKTEREHIIHLGGGHDHALPLLKAMDKSGQKTLIINFDAHCDTRIEEISHSGTPFRDFDREAKNPFHLVQIGIHNFANSPETLSPLKNNSEKIFFGPDPKELASQEGFVDAILTSCPFKVDERANLFISVDCDALSSSVMGAVSAVNHNGITPARLLEWIEILKDFPCRQKILGIYEYNPVFEDLSQKGARYLAGLIYNYLS